MTASLSPAKIAIKRRELVENGKEIPIEEIDIEKEIQDLLDHNPVDEWAANLKTKGGPTKPGVEEFTESFLRAAGKAINTERISSYLDRASNIVGHVIFTRALAESVQISNQAGAETYELMKALDDPLGVLIETAEWMSTVVYLEIDKAREAGRRAPVFALHTVMAGIWSLTSAMGHAWIIERDAERDECTTCGGKMSDPDHSLTLDQYLSGNGEGEHEED